MRFTFFMLAVALLASLMSFGASSQIVCSLGSGSASYNHSSDQRPSADAMQLVSAAFLAGKLVCGANCPAIVLFRNTTAANLMLIVDVGKNPGNDAGKAKLVYAPQFFTSAYDKFGDPGILALTAHVMGHALDDTMGAAWIDKNWTPELRADAWAGCVIAKENLSPADLISALSALAAYPSPTHPAWNMRAPVIRTGYSHCGGVEAKSN